MVIFDCPACPMKCKAYFIGVKSFLYLTGIRVQERYGSKIKFKLNPEPVSKRFSLLKFKKDENFNHRCRVVNALGVNTCSISRIRI